MNERGKTRARDSERIDTRCGGVFKLIQTVPVKKDISLNMEIELSGYAVPEHGFLPDFVQFVYVLCHIRRGAIIEGMICLAAQST
jgi:hypothetical protein